MALTTLTKKQTDAIGKITNLAKDIGLDEIKVSASDYKNKEAALAFGLSLSNEIKENGDRNVTVIVGSYPGDDDEIARFVNGAGLAL